MDTREANLPSDHNNIYPSFNASTSSSSSSFNSSPPDFLRDVQAAFKRHRMMPELNHLPRRLVAPRRETSKSSGVIIDSRTDESHDVSVKQIVQDSGTMMKNTSTLTAVNYESASITPPSISDAPTEEGNLMSIDVQRGQPGFSCQCRVNNMVDLPCVKCRDGPKKVQFALGNDTRPQDGGGVHFLLSIYSLRAEDLQKNSGVGLNILYLIG